MTTEVKATQYSIAWGYFDADLAPVATVKSGETVVIDTVSGGPNQILAKDAGFHMPPELSDIHARSPRQVPGHILTGPIAVEGAKPGHVLEVHILDVALRQDGGWNIIRPFAGTLPDDFPTARTEIIPLDT